MTDTSIPAFLDEKEDTQKAIIRATYLALCEHGYADLTIQRIADEFPKSKSLLYHHYEGKDELLLDFLDRMLSWAEEQPLGEDSEDAIEELEGVIDYWIAPEIVDEYHDYTRALVELRAQAAHDEDYRDYFTRADRFWRNRLVDLFQGGIDEGTFRDVDPERAAALFQALIIGVTTQRVTDNDNTAAQVNPEIKEWAKAYLLDGDDPGR